METRCEIERVVTDRSVCFDHNEAVPNAIREEPLGSNVLRSLLIPGLPYNSCSVISPALN